MVQVYYGESTYRRLDRRGDSHSLHESDCHLDYILALAKPTSVALWAKVSRVAFSPALDLLSKSCGASVGDDPPSLRFALVRVLRKGCSPALQQGSAGFAKTHAALGSAYTSKRRRGILPDRFQVILFPLAFSRPANACRNARVFHLPVDQSIRADGSFQHPDNLTRIDLLDDPCAGVRGFADTIGR